MKQTPEVALIKKPHIKTSYDKHQLQEIARCADPVNGPLYFLSNYFYVQHPTKGRVLYEPFDYQIRMLDGYANYRQVVSLLPRQSGKTVTAAGFLLWWAMFKSDQMVLIAAHKFSGASEIMTRIRFGYENCPDFLRAGIMDYNKQSITFDNGSRIQAQTTTETTGRGLSISLLYCDELSSVRPSIATEFWTSISLTLSTGGKAIITSTPNNPDDLFATIWNGANKTEDDFGNTIVGGVGANGFKAVTAHWSEHPDRDEAWAAEQKAMVGEELFEREIECRFITFEETLINPLKLASLKGIEPLENHGQVRWYVRPTPGNIYLVALDPSLGTGGDFSSIQVFEAKTNRQVAEWTNNKTLMEKQVQLMKEINTYLASITGRPQDIYYSVENNTIGEAALVAIREMGEENIPGTFISEPVRLGHVRHFRKGLNTTNTSKIAACAKLKSLVEHDRIKIYSKKLIRELHTFVSIGNTYKAKVGEHDDLVMSMIVIIRIMEILKNYIPELNDIRAIDSESLMPLPFVMSTSASSVY